MKFYRVRALFIVLVRCPVHTPVGTPMYGLLLSQSDQKVRSVFQSVYNNKRLRFMVARKNGKNKNELKLLTASLGNSCRMKTVTVNVIPTNKLRTIRTT